MPQVEFKETFITKPEQLKQRLISNEQRIMNVEKLKKELDEYIKPFKERIKDLQIEIDNEEAEIKQIFLQVYKTIDIVVPKKVFNPETNKYEISADSETGEVFMVEKQINNKGEKLFTYSPEKKSYKVDYSKITYETHPHLFVIKPILDDDLVKMHDNLPMIEIVKPATVGIQHSQLRKEIEANGIENKKQ